MNAAEKNKLKHDFLNSIVIIDCMSKSALSFLNKLSIDTSDTNQKQMDKFLYSMKAIREQNAKLKIYFQALLNEQ